MTRQTQQFRVRYVAWSGAVHEVETAARDTAEAIRTAREAKWPPTAVAFRLIDSAPIARRLISKAARS
jgi:hypothetical protein